MTTEKNPFATLVQIIGKVINIETNIGIVEDLNQNNAINIKAITGVVLIIEIGNLKNTFTYSFTPHKQPIKNPMLTLIKKATIILCNVKQKLIQNIFVLIICIIEIKTNFGEGKINSELITTEKICQNTKIEKNDKNVIKNFIFFFILFFNNKNLNLEVLHQLKKVHFSKRFLTTPDNFVFLF
mgnify:FL=1